MTHLKIAECCPRAPLLPLDAFKKQRFPQKYQKPSAKAIQSLGAKASGIRRGVAARVDL